MTETCKVEVINTVMDTALERKLVFLFEKEWNEPVQAAIKALPEAVAYEVSTRTDEATDSLIYKRWNLKMSVNTTTDGEYRITNILGARPTMSALTRGSSGWYCNEDELLCFFTEEDTRAWTLQDLDTQVEMNAMYGLDLLCEKQEQRIRDLRQYTNSVAALRDYFRGKYVSFPFGDTSTFALP